MNHIWTQEMRDLVELFVRRGLLTRPRPQTTEQVMAAHQSSVREYNKAKKQAEQSKKQANRAKKPFRNKHEHIDRSY